MKYSNLPNEIWIGREGEQGAREITFDISVEQEQWNNAVPTLVYVRPSEKIAYPATVSVSDGILTWVPDGFATAIRGARGFIQIIFTSTEDNETIIGKSKVMRMQVCESLTASEDPPEPYTTWVEDLLAAAAEATQAAEDAHDAADNATTAAGNATTAANNATSAAQSAVSATSALNTAIAQVQNEIEEAQEDIDGIEGQITDIIAQIQQEGNTQKTAVNNAGVAQVQAVEDAGTTQVGLVNSAGTTQVGNVTSAGTTQVNAVNSAGSTQVGEVNTTGTTQKNAVIAEGTTQVGLVTAKGTEQIGLVTAEGTTQIGLVAAEGTTQVGLVEDEGDAQIARIQSVSNNKADVIISSASGAVASFTDGADGMPMESVVCSIEPVQDLNGYDNPWAGGGNVNLFDMDTVTEDTRVNANGTATLANYSCSDFIPIEANTTYFCSNIASSSAGVTGVYFYDSNKTYTTSKPGLSSYSVTSGASDAYMRINLPSANLSTVQVEKGSTATAWTPYENICPITGFTGLTLSHSDADTSDPTTLAIDWTTEAGTVYGGTLDVVSGVLTVTSELITLDGTNRKITGKWEETTYGSACYATSFGRRKYFAESKSNVFRRTTGSYSYMPLYSFVGGSGSSDTITFVFPTGYTVADANDWLAEMSSNGTPVVITRALATPLTYTLTAQEVDSLLGTNNLWHNANGNTSATYRADTKLYIDQAIANAIANLS